MQLSFNFVLLMVRKTNVWPVKSGTHPESESLICKNLCDMKYQ